VLRTPRALILLYSNHDFHLHDRSVIGALFSTLLSLLDGEIVSLPRAGDTRESIAPIATTATVGLLQSQWLGVPGLKRSGIVPKPLEDGGINHRAAWQATLMQVRDALRRCALACVMQRRESSHDRHLTPSIVTRSCLQSRNTPLLPPASTRAAH
jgi:hypothetical protein